MTPEQQAVLDAALALQSLQDDEGGPECLKGYVWQDGLTRVFVAGRAYRKSLELAPAKNPWTQPQEIAMAYDLRALTDRVVFLENFINPSTKPESLESQPRYYFDGNYVCKRTKDWPHQTICCVAGSDGAWGARIAMLLNESEAK